LTGLPEILLGQVPTLIESRFADCS
jgi:hypothetical protein